MIKISPEILQAINQHKPIVALESTVITHGLPYPVNEQLALDMVNEVRKFGAIPAVIAALHGEVWIGLSPDQVKTLVIERDSIKLGVRDISTAITEHKSGGTTVSATLFLGHKAGLQVFATGGIGGVHRGARYDISTDLYQLSNTPMIVVCSGAKAILDLSATLEVLETLGVPVVGYKTDEFPAFYSNNSGLPVNTSVGSSSEVAELARVHWEIGMKSAILVVQPLPEDIAIPAEEIKDAIDQAVNEASEQGIQGQPVTPYLLNRVSELTGRKSLEANIALLINNAALAAKISKSLSNLRD